MDATNNATPVRTERSGWDPYALPAGTPRQQIIAGLRILATWLEDHPDMPAPDAVRAQYSELAGGRAERLALVESTADRLGLEPVVHDDQAYVSRRFGEYPAYLEYTVAAALPEPTTAEVVSAALES